MVNRRGGFRARASASCDSARARDLVAAAIAGCWRLVALVTTCEALRVDLREGSPEHGDFERINVLLGHFDARSAATG